MTHNKDSIVLGGGCFWCLHSAYSLVNGVSEVLQGYAGGSLQDPSYEDVISERAGHAEVVMLTFNPSVISLSEILDIFWTIHDPTTLNRQGADVGVQYRSIILHHSAEQKQAAESSKTSAQDVWGGKIITEIEPLDKFYPAEEYHYDYESTRPDYCQIVINPKLSRLREKFASKLKIT